MDSESDFEAKPDPTTDMVCVFKDKARINDMGWEANLEKQVTLKLLLGVGLPLIADALLSQVVVC